MFTTEKFTKVEATVAKRLVSFLSSAVCCPGLDGSVGVVKDLGFPTIIHVYSPRSTVRPGGVSPQLEVTSARNKTLRQTIWDTSVDNKGVISRTTVGETVFSKPNS